MNNRLVLGTAGLGMDYGVANTRGKPSLKKSYEIVKCALDRGIAYFDTALAYGDAETRLGRILKDLGMAGKARIISKIPGRLSSMDEAKVLKALAGCIKRLNISSLYGLLLHDQTNLVSWGKKASRIVKKIRKEKIAGHIGISLYKWQDALAVLRMDDFDILQMPFNIFDQSFYREKVYKSARKHGKKVYLRSIFLQGLLLMGTSALKGSLRRFSGYLEKRDNLCREFGLNKKELAIGYVKKRANGAYIIFGAETPGQVVETTEIFKKINIKEPMAKRIEEELTIVDEDIIDPSKWMKFRDGSYGKQ